MRKRTSGDAEDRPAEGRFDVLDVEHLAEVEVSSEDAERPIEHALLPRHSSGWRAGTPGPQTIRLWFDEPQPITRIYLHFHEPDTERTQECVVRWGRKGGEPPQEIVRQQWNFSPLGSTHEIEDYRVTLEDVSLIELEITPDVRGSEARASLLQFFLG